MQTPDCCGMYKIPGRCTCDIAINFAYIGMMKTHVIERRFITCNEKSEMENS